MLAGGNPPRPRLLTSSERGGIRHRELNTDKSHHSAFSYLPATFCSRMRNARRSVAVLLRRSRISRRRLRSPALRTSWRTRRDDIPANATHARRAGWTTSGEPAASRTPAPSGRGGKPAIRVLDIGRSRRLMRSMWAARSAWNPAGPQRGCRLAAVKISQARAADEPVSRAGLRIVPGPSPPGSVFISNRAHLKYSAATS